MKAIPRNGWLLFGLAAIVASYLGCWLTRPQDLTIALLVPLVLTTTCIMHLRREWPLVAAAVVVSITLLALIQPEFTRLHWRELCWLAMAQLTLGVASYLVDAVPWGYAQSHTRLEDRFRRQAEKLQTVRESQESAEQRVLQFESDRRALLEHLPVHVIQKNRNGEFTFVSRSFCELVDQSYDNLIGKTDFDVFPDEAASKFVEDDRKVMESGGVFSDVERTQLPDKTVSYMQVRKAPIHDADGQVIGVQGIFWDVTEEHTSRQELQRIESLTHALINAALDAVLIVDSDGHVLEANPASEKILGYTRDASYQHPPIGKIMQSSLEEPGERATDPRDGETTFQRKIPISQILRSATGKRIEAKLRRSDDIWFDGEISTHPLDVDGSQGWAIFIRDITRRKKSQQDLLTAKNVAEQANAAKTEFVANVSHELRTPLTGIIGLHDLLDRGQLEDRQRDYLKLAKLSAGNLLTLIDDLLDFSKIEAGHIDIESVAFSLVDCVEEAVNALAARAQFKGLEILIEFDEVLPGELTGDPHRIRQILLNLAGNAIKFTERGEIRVCVGMVNHSASELAADEEVCLRIEVHDSGIGIAPEKRSIIFEAFRQADSSTTRRYGGTGLGLTICQDLVQKMGGRIGITDARDLNGERTRGSCFFFELPLIATDSIQLGPPSPKVGEDVVLAATDCTWSALLGREIKRLGFELTIMPVEQLLNRQPPHLFAAGNQTTVIADYRELCWQEESTAPVVTKWILLSPLYSEDHDQVPNWLNYSNVTWLARPVRRKELQAALCVEDVGLPSSAGADTTSATERAANILLVEDSLISQTVLRDMLQGLGHQVTVADSGRAAINSCRERLFDLVLMDIQMPDCDGLEATKVIRQAESGLGRRQTIYALTAHATAADRAQCEDVGMDGFLVKPISLESLAASVAESITGQANGKSTIATEPDDSAAGNAASEQANNDSTEETEFVVERALENAPDWQQLLNMMNGNEALLRDVLSLLIREAPKLGRNFKQAVKQGRIKDARRAVHTLKSNVRHVGLTRIASYAEQLEYLARDEQHEQLGNAVPSVTEVANSVADWSEQMLNGQA